MEASLVEQSPALEPISISDPAARPGTVDQGPTPARDALKLLRNE
jgi:hypothetical protein